MWVDTHPGEGGVGGTGSGHEDGSKEPEPLIYGPTGQVVVEKAPPKVGFRKPDAVRVRR